jgi:hypothetical protein
LSPKRKGPRPKHVPIRTCVACRQSSAKRELLRIVRDPAGRVQLDPTGKKPGRGAYLCTFYECWEQALTSGLLSRALKTTLSDEDSQALWNFAKTLPRKVRTATMETGATAPMHQGGDV